LKTGATPEMAQPASSLKTTSSRCAGDKQTNPAAVPWMSKHDFSNQILTLSEQFPCILRHSSDGPGSVT